MKLHSLEIARKHSYDSDSQLCAKAHFEGPGGKIQVELAPGFIVRVLALIEEDAAERAKRLGASVTTAMTDAVDEARLISADSPLKALEG